MGYIRRGLLYKYTEYLPITDKTPMLSLCEGDTPLVRAPMLESVIGCEELYFKLEGCNPTGSFKDRGMVMAIAQAAEAGSKAVMCASTGNTSASAAAYAARMGMQAIIVIPEGKIALGKLAQAIMHGAKIVAIDGNFDQALNMVREMTSKHPVTLVNSINPHRIEGQKTGAFEIVDALGDAPDILAIPVGNAGNITAYWKGFKEYHAAGKSTKLPKMTGFQAEGAAPIVLGHPIEKPETIATAIRIGNPASWKKAEAARDESNGSISMVSDAQILEAYHMMAEKVGVFAEPASCAPLAGLLKLKRNGADFSGKKIVCIATGNGLKDPDNAIKDFQGIIRVPADLASIEKQLGW